MTNHLAKTSGFVSITQDDRVVSDTQDSPVCLGPVPRAHKHLPESEMLLDVLMEGLYPDPLKVEFDHFGFDHFQVVGNKESGDIPRFGNKQEDSSDSWQMDENLGDLVASLFGSSDCFVLSGSLGQVTQRGFSSSEFHDSVSLDRGEKRPFCLRNKIENGSARIPGIHQHGQGSMDFFDRLGKDVLGNVYLAFECPFRACFLGTITSNGPDKALSTNLHNARDCAQSPNKTVCSVMDSGSFDFLAFSGTSGIVQNQEILVGGDLPTDLPLILRFEALYLLGRSHQKLVKSVGIAAPKVASNFSDRTEFDQRDQSDPIDEEVFPLRFVQNSQESGEISRNFVGCRFAHGFHALLLALSGLEGFGWKPFLF